MYGHASLAGSQYKVMVVYFINNVVWYHLAEISSLSRWHQFMKYSIILAPTITS